MSSLQAELRGKRIPENKEDMETITIMTKSKSAKDLVGNLVFHSRCKHILNKYHFIRDRVELGQIQLEFVYSEDNGADMLTKHASVGVMERNKKEIGMM